jgi:hypothetical protein
MNRTLAPADTAHYDPRLAELSTRSGSLACGSRPCTPTLWSTKATIMVLDCPACLDQEGALRCWLPLAAGTIPEDHAQAAEQDLLAAERRTALRATFGPLAGCHAAVVVILTAGAG